MCWPRFPPWCILIIWETTVFQDLKHFKESFWSWAIQTIQQTLTLHCFKILINLTPIDCWYFHANEVLIGMNKVGNSRPTIQDLFEDFQPGLEQVPCFIYMELSHFLRPEIWGAHSQAIFLEICLYSETQSSEKRAKKMKGKVGIRKPEKVNKTGIWSTQVKSRRQESWSQK